MCKSLINELNIECIDTSTYIGNSGKFLKALTEMSNKVNNFYSYQSDLIKLINEKRNKNRTV